MKLTNATEKAFAVVMMIATQEAGMAIPSSVFVKYLNISDSYTKKLLRFLVVGNVIGSSPGNNGGFKLKRKLSDISILEVVQAIEGEINTFQSKTTLESTFVSIPDLVGHANQVLAETFRSADQLWSKDLASKNLEQLIIGVFGSTKRNINWLEVS